MQEHKVSLEWNRQGKSFDYEKYSRDHAIIFGEGTRVCASASPEFHGNPSCLDPEQAFVSSLASCHMLTFLAIASKKGYIVESYRDQCAAQLGRNERRKPAVVKAILSPVVEFGAGKKPSQEEYETLHDRAHSACFIANSIAQCVKVTVHPTMT